MKLNELITKQLTIPIDSLAKDTELCRDVQTALVKQGYPLLLDGIYGPATKAAFEKFKKANYLSNPGDLGPTTAQKLLASPKQLVNKAQAEGVYGRTITDAQLADLNRCLIKFEINTNARIRHFLSQTAHESGGLRWLKELASGEAYEGRRDLGNVHPGDGKKYRGTGVLQTTGRANFQALANYMNDPRVMEGCDYVAATYPFTSAGVWWTKNNMNALCDRGATVEQVTRRVNGGLNGLADRKLYYNKALKYFP